MKICNACGHNNDDSLKFCGECGARLDTGKDPFVGTVIDNRYEVIERIAEGGMGSVYRARHLRIDKSIALKILHPELARDKKFLARFENEARTVAALDHPNIVRVYDTGPVRDTYFIAMDFIEGHDLVDIIKRRGRLPVEEAFSITAQVAEGLHYAHDRGILHRDIKPANIIVDKSGRPVITDFGIAKAIGEKGQTTTGTAVGTPEYMSLEQVKGLELDERTDIYSLGVVLYEMLTGESPFRSDTGISTIAKILSEEVPPVERLRPDLPGWALEAVRRAMAKDRESRYDSTGKFLDEIKRITGSARMVPARSRIIEKTQLIKGSNNVRPREGSVKKIAGKSIYTADQKKSIAVVVIIVIILVIGAVTLIHHSRGSRTDTIPAVTGGENQAPPPIKKVKLTIATDAAYPPFEFINTANGEIVGFDIDLMNEIAKMGGFEVRFINTPWDGIFVGLDNNNYDAVISAVSITDARKVNYYFSDPYYSIYQALVVRAADAGGYKTLVDLGGRKIGAQIGTIGAIFLSEHPNVRLVNYDDNGIAIEALARGYVDAVVCDHPVAFDYALVNPSFKGRLVVSNPRITDVTELYGIVAKKGNTKVIGLMNSGIRNLPADVVPTLEKKWKMRH